MKDLPKKRFQEVESHETPCTCNQAIQIAVAQAWLCRSNRHYFCSLPPSDGDLSRVLVLIDNSVYIQASTLAIAGFKSATKSFEQLQPLFKSTSREFTTTGLLLRIMDLLIGKKYKLHKKIGGATSRTLILSCTSCSSLQPCLVF